MRIGVLSDTHGNIRRARAAIAQMGAVSHLLHAGDFLEDARKLQVMTGIPCTGVLGNCDYQIDGALETVVELSGQRIFLTHGHRYRVKSGYRELILRAVELGVQIVVFGHTHVAELFWEEGILFLNPGSTFQPRDGGRPSYALLELIDGRVWPSLHRF